MNKSSPKTLDSDVKYTMDRAVSVAKELIRHSPSPTQTPLLTGVERKTGGLSGKGRGLWSIPNYEKLYKITRNGRIWGIKRGNWISQTDNGSGRLKVELWKDGRRKNYKVHKLVALTFIPNPDNKRCINHKDGDKLNNDADNLEWVTHKENVQHAIENGLMWFQKDSI